MGTMERCMEAIGGMGMAGGAVSTMLLVVAFLGFVWVLGLAAILGLGIWGVRSLSTGARR